MSIHPTSIIENSTLGKNVSVGPFCYISESTIEDWVTIEGHARIEKSTIGKETQLLWGALIRESTLERSCSIGCEVKRSHLGENNTAKHPGTTIGSVTTGRWVNFWSGCKFANYDGHGKGTFILWDNVFLGCNVVISVKANQTTHIHDNVKIGAGVHISTNIPSDSLVYMDRDSGKFTLREGYLAAPWKLNN